MNKILVADDDIDFLNLMKNTLGDQYIVKTASGGKQILSDIKTFKPDLILLDVFMKKYDGRQICKEINIPKKFVHLPVIIVSANPYSLANYESYGADDSILKPIKFDDLIHKIERLLKIKNAHENIITPFS